MTAIAGTATGEVAPVGSQRGARIRRTVAYALLIGYALLMFVPFAWTVATSLKPLAETLRPGIDFVPDELTLEGYATAWTELSPSLPQLFLNSAIIAGAVTLLNLIFDSLGGYAFARLRFPGREALFVLVLATLMIPDQLRLVPVFNTLTAMGLVGRGLASYIGIILILAVSGTGLFLMRQYFMSIPYDLEEAAKIDGANIVQTFWKVILPLAGPALAAVAILQFQGTWNGFFWPLILLRDETQWTLPLGLGQFRFLYQTNWPPLMALVVISTIPIVILYVFFQRYFVAGIAASGVKG